MRKLLVVLLCVLLSASYVHARTGGMNGMDSSPINVITKETLADAPAGTSISDIINFTPSSADQQVQRLDLGQAQINLRNNLVLVNGRRMTAKQESDLGGFLSQEANAIPQAMIDRIEVLKDGASSVYGSDAIGGVVNIITRKDLHPDELPDLSKFTPQESQWAADGIPVGKIGITNSGGQFNYGLSAYHKDAWTWQPGFSLGESYGLHGPVIALGKTPQGPGLSIYNDYGAHIGDVSKIKIGYDPGITAQYLLRAEYETLNPFYSQADTIFKPSDFNPYGVIILPSGRSMGDLYQTGDILNNSLTHFKGYDDSLEALDGKCVPPYGRELVFPRTVLKKKIKEPQQEILPNDPLYQRSKAQKKGGFPLVTGLVGLVSVGAGVVGMGDLDEADKKGPDVRDQYSLPQIGFLPKSDPKSAWNLVDAETKNVTVAVIDSGLDLTHPDGPEFIWTNDKEIPGNKIDDDKNGYVDDVHGWNFLEENNDLKDLRGHGSVVAGIIAARTNNGKGMAGINPGAVIMPLKVADKFGNTNSLNIFRAIKYAVLHGARVINISLGSRGVSQLERLAVNFARAKGVLIVVASGNDGEDIGLYGPASAGNLLAVGAVNFDGTRSTVSNWGPNNALMAPGEEIYSLHSKDARWDGPSGNKERLYTKVSGTSFSAPMVAATASLLLVKDPALTPDQLEDILLSTAEHRAQDNWNARTGAGLLDAAKALSSINEDHFNVKITGVKPAYKGKSKNIETVDVYATVRGKVDYFTVEIGKGKNARQFKPVIGIAGQQASDDLVAVLRDDQLRGSNEWLILVRAKDKAGKEYTAQTPLILK